MPIDTADSFTRARAAAGILLFNEDGHVLMVVPSYKDYLDIPGGYISHGETPTEAAAREVKEELGLDLPVERLLVADWAPNDSEGDKLLFVFDGGVLTQHQLDLIKLPPDELTGFKFIPADQIADRTIPRLARRIAQAIEARDEGRARYLEHGQPKV